MSELFGTIPDRCRRCPYFSEILDELAMVDAIQDTLRESYKALAAENEPALEEMMRHIRIRNQHLREGLARYALLPLECGGSRQVTAVMGDGSITATDCSSPRDPNTPPACG